MKLVVYELYKVFRIRLIAFLFCLAILISSVSGIFIQKSICTDDFIKYINHSVSDDKPVGIAVAEALNCYEGAKPNFDEGLQELGRFGLMVNYESIISAKIEQLNAQKSLSVFDEYTATDAQKYIDEYNVILQNSKSTEYISYGTEILTQNEIANLLLLFAIVIISFFIGFSDKICGASFLIFTTRKGRSNTAIAKILSLFIICIFSVVIVFTSLLITGDIRFSLGDLSRNIQSLPEFLYSTLNISVLDYLILFYLEKIFALFLYGMIIMTFSAVCKSAVFTSCVVALIGIAEGLMFFLIPESSAFMLLSKINIVSCYETNSLLSSYEHINLFSCPVELYLVVFIMLAVLLVILITVYILILSKKNSPGLKHGVFINKLFSLSGIISIRKSSSLVFHEYFKTLVSNKAALILCGVAALSVVYYSSLNVEYDPADLRYKEYINRFGGTVTQETMDFINSEAEYYSDLELQKDIAYATGNTNEYLRVSEELKKYPGFVKFRNRAEYIFENSDKDLMLIYETGFEKLLDSSNNKPQVMTIALIFVLIILVIPMYSNDNKKGLTLLIRTTVNGREKLFLLRSIISALLSVVIYVAVFLPDVLFVYNNYDLSGYDAKAQSLEILKEVSDLSVIGYLIISYAIRFVTVLIISFSLLRISFNSKNFIVGIIIGIALFILPVGISIILPIAQKLWITPFVCGTVIYDFNSANFIFTVIVFATIIVLVPFKNISTSYKMQKAKYDNGFM